MTRNILRREACEVLLVHSRQKITEDLLADSGTEEPQGPYDTFVYHKHDGCAVSILELAVIVRDTARQYNANPSEGVRRA